MANKKRYTDRVLAHAESKKCIDYNDKDFPEIVEYLNSENFRAFIDGLKQIVKNKHPEMNETEILEYLEQVLLIETDAVPRTTLLYDWIRDKKRPPKNKMSRETMFKIALALKLTLQETVEFFNKVYLDRAFDYRNHKDVIYRYCLINGKSYEYAKGMINRIIIPDTDCDKLCRTTEEIIQNICELDDEEDLIKYINDNIENFLVNSKTAKRNFDICLKRAREYALDEIKLYHKRFNNISIEKNTVFDKELFETITGLIISAKNTKNCENDCKDVLLKEGKVFKNNEFPIEIAENFPNKKTFSNSKIGIDELRKGLIILASYCSWSQIKSERRNGVGVSSKTIQNDYKTYIATIDDILNECNLPPLYPGNPFDWIFVFSAMTKLPLDAFREILYFAIYKDEVA